MITNDSNMNLTRKLHSRSSPPCAIVVERLLASNVLHRFRSTSRIMFRAMSSKCDRDSNVQPSRSYEVRSGEHILKCVASLKFAFTIRMPWKPSTSCSPISALSQWPLRRSISRTTRAKPMPDDFWNSPALRWRNWTASRSCTFPARRAKVRRARWSSRFCVRAAFGPASTARRIWSM